MPRHPCQERITPRQSLLQIHQRLSDTYQSKPPVALSRLVSFAFELVYDNEHIRVADDLMNCLVPAFYRPRVRPRRLRRDISEAKRGQEKTNRACL
jgi:hypothetical protein